ncbi:hypothetical protein [Nocardia neocaledoniensis]|uniref:hypothetical protein n=1 Tax=Nocardia neocaledoniensis TaxID=236511 RepID=UPI00245908C3|nr:hypothetical protein [Nocardia neocaledoniensis]
MSGRADDAPTTRGARRWALATAVSPLTLPLLGFGVAVVLGPITGGESGDLAWNWAFVTLFGMPVFGPCPPPNSRSSPSRTP